MCMIVLQQYLVLIVFFWIILLKVYQVSGTRYVLVLLYYSTSRLCKW